MSTERAEIIRLIDEARLAGARQSQACKIIGISGRTLQRWRQGDTPDGRIDANHAPANKLTEMEKQRIIQTANKPEYADLPPSKIVPKLADKGVYIASESTFYRVLNAATSYSTDKKQNPTGRLKSHAL